LKAKVGEPSLNCPLGGPPKRDMLQASDSFDGPRQPLIDSPSPAFGERGE